MTDVLWCTQHVPDGVRSWAIANYLSIWTCRTCGATATHKTMEDAS